MSASTVTTMRSSTNAEQHVRIIAELGVGLHGRVYLVSVLDDKGQHSHFRAMKQSFRWNDEYVTHDVIREANLAQLQLLQKERDQQLLTADAMYLGKTYSISLMEPLEGTLKDIYEALTVYIPKHEEPAAEGEDEAEEVADDDAAEEDEAAVGSDADISDAESLGTDSEDDMEEDEDDEEGGDDEHDVSDDGNADNADDVEDTNDADEGEETSGAVIAVEQADHDMELDFSVAPVVPAEPQQALEYRDGQVKGTDDLDVAPPTCFRSGDYVVITYEQHNDKQRGWGVLHRLVGVSVTGSDLKLARETFDLWEQRENKTLHQSLVDYYHVDDLDKPNGMECFVLDMVTQLLQCQRNMNQLGFTFDDVRSSNVGFRILAAGAIQLTYINAGHVKRLSMPYDANCGMLDPESLPREFFERDALVSQSVDVWQLGVLIGRLFYPHEAFLPERQFPADHPDKEADEVDDAVAAAFDEIQGWGSLDGEYYAWFKDRMELRGLHMFIDEKGNNVDDDDGDDPDKLWYEINITPATLDALTKHIVTRRSYTRAMPYWFWRWFLQFFIQDPSIRPSAAMLLRQLGEGETRRVKQLRKKATPAMFGLNTDSPTVAGTWTPTAYKYHAPRSWKKISQPIIAQAPELNASERCAIVTFLRRLAASEVDDYVWNMPLLLQSIELYGKLRDGGLFKTESVESLFAAVFLLVDRTWFIVDRFVEGSVYLALVDQQVLHDVLLALNGVVDPHHTMHRAILWRAQEQLAVVRDVVTHADNQLYNAYGYKLTAWEHLVELLHWNEVCALLVGSPRIDDATAVRTAKTAATGTESGFEVTAAHPVYDLVRDPQDRFVYTLYDRATAPSDS